ncbi:glycosyltransferase family protein [Pseudochryseolinea flava]|uniref:glycosyltransferase n=1 Tax=Pseudochryseolinea flava TaxID=2059302 RepID=UPI00140228FF|nr:glycosyltransferase [Pseudochryseolinea flava]
MSVITSKDPTLFMEPDASLSHYGEGIDVATTLNIVENRYINYLIRKVNPAWLQRPDSKFSFWWQSQRAIASIKDKPDILYSRSYPVSSTLLALQLKKKWDIPWVLHLSDPWAQSSSSFLSPATKFTESARVWNKAQELLCFSLADRISLTSQKTIDLYAKIYPQFREKFVYYPNVFDDELIQSNPYARGKKLKIVYNGGFGDARSPLPYLEAIASLWKAHQPEIGNAIEFLFTGEMTRANTEIFDRYRHISWINHRGVIAYRDVVSMQREADILVNIDSDIPDPNHAVFFPSKLLDYMVAQRRIIAITNRHSTTHDVVHGKLGDCFSFTEVKELATFLYHVYQRYLQNDAAFFTKSEVGSEYSAKFNASRLVDLFTHLAKIG